MREGEREREKEQLAFITRTVSVGWFWDWPNNKNALNSLIKISKARPTDFAINRDRSLTRKDILSK